MILRLPLLFLAGLLAGWWLAGAPLLNSALPARAAGIDSPVSRLSPPPAASGTRVTGPRLLDRHIVISADDLSAQLRERESVGLHLEDPEPAVRSESDRIGERIGLAAQERNLLAEILRNAADERREWEKRNVKIETAATGHWKLRFPGDHGVSQASLRARLEEAFGPEAAAAIHLAADLGNFFTLGSQAPFPNHGEVEIRAVRTNTPPDRSPDPEGDSVRFILRVGDSESVRTTKITHFEESAFRFRHLLGTTDQLLQAATEVARLSKP